VAISGTVRFEEYLGACRLTAREVQDLDRLVEARASGLLLRWRAGRDRELTPATLREALAHHRPGPCGVTVYYQRNGREARLELAAEWTVRPTRELRERLSALVGVDGFRFVYEGVPR
jgi:DNA polymerase III alpha subunit